MYCLFQSQRVHLILLLPDSVDNINEILTSLAKENLLQAVKSLPLRETQVALPQLAILTKDLDLAPFLHRIGLDKLFTNPHSHIRSIKQNVYFSTSFVAVNSVGSVMTLLGRLHFDFAWWFYLLSLLCSSTLFVFLCVPVWIICVKYYFFTVYKFELSQGHICRDVRNPPPSNQHHHPQI